MKKLLTVVAFSSFAIFFTSCKKDYQCTCTKGSGATATSYTTTIVNQKKKGALASCKALEGPGLNGGVTTDIKCNIK